MLIVWMIIAFIFGALAGATLTIVLFSRDPYHDEGGNDE